MHTGILRTSAKYALKVAGTVKVNEIHNFTKS